ncbi:MAG TPA: class IV adenylate cyclase [Candidatus Paceibacterota bacterium]|nr:class IV adenylate cyclase [Candidatus Paceibacterota bacterium]
MEIELEAKFLNIDKESLRALLLAGGATLVHAERHMKRKNLDFPDRRLEKIGGWVRIRDEGDKVALSYKQIDNLRLEGTKEILVTVDDFEKTCNFLSAIGMTVKALQETKRERWEMEGVEVTIDTWPWIPSFVELEGKSEEALKNVAEKLGLNWTEAMHGSVESAYQKYYDITKEEFNKCEAITFIPTPAWLETRRK